MLSSDRIQEPSICGVNNNILIPPLQTDAEKHLHIDRNSLWSGDDLKRDGGLDSGMKMESGCKWRKNPSDLSDESDKSTSGRKNTVISQTGSWRRGMTAQVGITTPRTKTSGTLKTPGTGTPGFKSISLLEGRTTRVH